MLLICLFSLTARSQELFKRQRMEAVAGVGISQFFGDVGGFSQTSNILGFKDIIFHQTRFNFEGALKYRFLKEVSVKLSFNSGIFHSIDTKGSNEGRNFEASTFYFEPLVTGEYYFIKSSQEGKYSFYKGKRILGSLFSFMDFYAFTGIGGVSYNVKVNAELAARGHKKSGFTAVIPVGVGANFLYSNDYIFGIELGGRYTFSDYLDAYTSQFSKSNDVYYLLNFTFTYRIPTLRNGMPKFLSKRKF
jgi:hypothetical protein